MHSVRTQVSLEGEKTRKEMKTIVTSLDDQAGLSTALKERVERVRHCACRCARMHAHIPTHARTACTVMHAYEGGPLYAVLLTYAVAHSVAAQSATRRQQSLRKGDSPYSIGTGALTIRSAHAAASGDENGE